jgi:hypothetical protein
MRYIIVTTAEFLVDVEDEGDAILAAEDAVNATALALVRTLNGDLGEVTAYQELYDE